MVKNKWKIGFFILLGLIAASILLFWILISMPAEESKIEPDRNNAAMDDVAFHVSTNKRDLNRVINHYLEEEMKNSQFEYQVLLTDEVELYGTIPIFSQELELKLTFEPQALENGDLILKQRSISVGRLNLPVSTVLKFVRDSYHLPEAVEIQPKEERVYVSMQRLKLKSDIKVRVNEFDLKKDNIKFTLLVPAD
ncbi:YpmS family protein [Mesobacillus sp. AQ2]|uniref:YpmS family protein n=1 Tax=Bacillaceae TaxID=186817 RepID=UPI0011A8383F|nr:MULTISPECIES: YpmS family protein [Bacillaceae]MCM3122080.1 YpmS family protein [Mesobacillus sp. MER 33]MCM3232044.1 YpmS family protein [Mesobacillus sp. MER 48]WHX39000.1 YpmS family protein [Mesobacillus sp. AQ2]